MINSLSKDSHITLPNAFPNFKHSDRNSGRNYVHSAHVNKSEHKNDIFINRPANVSFSGLFSAKPKVFHSMGKNLEAMSDGVIRDLRQTVRTFVTDDLKVAADKNTNSAKIKEIITGAVDFIYKGENSVNADVATFMKNEKNVELVNNLLNNAKAVSQKTDNNKFVNVDFDAQEYKDFVKKEVADSLDVLDSIEGKEAKYKNSHLHDFLEKAESSQAVFSALFAAGLTCILRPLTIVALPGKKGKDDKKYASAHSISSGLIGYAVAVLVGSPIAYGLSKIEKNPNKFLNDEKHGYLLEIEEYKNGIVKNVKKNFEDLKGLSKFSVTRKYINMIPEILLGPPKAIVTIALIPPILKYVFGIEKKVPVNAQNVLKPTQNYLAINFRGANQGESASKSDSEVK